MEACSQLLRRWQTYSDLPEFTELVTARVSSAGNMPCYGFCYGFAMTSGLYGCQVWATSSLTYDSSNITPAHVLHLGFLKRLLSVKKGTDTYCVLSKTGQMPIFFYWFRCIIRFWNSLLSSINPLLEKVVQADLLIANRSDTGLIRFCTHSTSTSQQFLNAIRSREAVNIKQFELTLRERIIGSWRELP